MQGEAEGASRVGSSTIEVAEGRLFDEHAAPVAVRPIGHAVREPPLHEPVARPAPLAPQHPLRETMFWRLRREITQAALLELARGTPFVFTPVFLAAGALAYFRSLSEPPLVALIMAGACLALATYLLRTRLVVQMTAAALLCIALGAFFAKVETLRVGTRMLGGEIATRLTGRVEAIDHLANGRIRLTLEILATERPKLRYAPDRVRISARAVPVGLKAGDVVQGIARLLPPLGPIRPGGYDFSFESYFDGIGATGFFLTQPAVLPPTSRPGAWQGFLAAVENLRDALAGRIRTQISGAEGEIAAALVAGVRAGIPEDVNEALRRTGLAHILSISGLHMALVAATIMGAMRLAFACFQTFSARHPVRKYAALVALLALAAYLFVSGSQVAAQRSFIMIAIMLVALLFDHAALTMRNLALAALIVIVVSPHEVVGPSFQMSFAATVALIGAYAAWARYRPMAPQPSHHRAIARGMLRTVALYALGLAATSLLAGTATAIFGAYHFQRVSPLSLAANLAAMPIVSLLVMPFAVLGMVAMPFGLDAVPFTIMGQGLRLMIAIAMWFSSRSPLDAVGLVAPAAVAALTTALLLATLLTTWLRVTAVPFLAIGLALLLTPPAPLIFVSEDARQVAFRAADGSLAIDRRRPNAFATENWLRATRSEKLVKPLFVHAEIAAASASNAVFGPGFSCSASACFAEPFAGERIMTTADVPSAKGSCGMVQVVIVGDATGGELCSGSPTLVVTRRDLARYGSAMIFRDPPDTPASSWLDLFAAATGASALSERSTSQFKGGTRANQASAKGRYRLVHAVVEPYRPWHEHRRFSREARGIAPWKPDPARGKRNGQRARPEPDQPPAGSSRGGRQAIADYDQYLRISPTSRP